MSPSFGLNLLSLLVDIASGTGWTFYPPLSSKVAHLAHSVDCLIFMLHLLSFSSIRSRVNFLSTSSNYKHGDFYRLHIFV